jgi:metallophosphoesterase (TIGR03767 family)
MTTEDRRLLPGPEGPGGYRRLRESPGEPHQLQAGEAIPPGSRPVLVFIQLSDTHVMDSQSPARVELLDRYADPDLVPFGESRTVGTYRPQELFTHHVVEAMVQAANAITRGPMSGAPVDFAVVTGDLTDNAQHNELQSFLGLLNGRVVAPDSGSAEQYEGVASSGDPRYWHPRGEIDDLPRTRYGFPTAADSLDAARRPFQASGFRVPWLSVYGNHDNQLQGTIPASADLERIATGPHKLITPPETLDPADVLTRLEDTEVGALAELIGGAAMTVTPDPERRLVSRTQHLSAHLDSGGTPAGHGYGYENLVAGVCYYAYDVGDRVRVIVLDTVNPHGGWQGSLDPAQLSWLQFQLAAAEGRLVVLFSHHPLETMVNDRAPPGQRRVLGDEVRALFVEHPCVVLWVNGHTHRHQVTPVCRADGQTGFWQVTTASHIDWPQQSRVVELLESPDGTVTIACTVFDSAAPAQPAPGRDDPLTLASLSRELSANDWQTRDAILAEAVDGSGGSGGGGAGRPEDRNVILTLPASPARSGRSLEGLSAEALDIAEGLLSLVDGMEDLPYGGEPVSQRAHSLQCATLAVGAGGSDELVAAALLHDIGYTPWVQAAAPRRSHERAAAAFLLPLLGEEVARLVAHHVAAKRYLVATQDGYVQTLSDASRRSLRAQDGPASAAEVAAWREHPWWPQAVLLRSWDDRAKVPGAPTLSGSWFRNLLARLACA